MSSPRSASRPTRPGVIPANTYKGQTRTSPTVAIQNFLVTHEGVSTETVYNMTKSMFDKPRPDGRRARCRQGHQEGRRRQGMPVPLHPGAEKYYREAGLIK
jgi:TRAP transporter TAXI family solute receptor